LEKLPVIKGGAVGQGEAGEKVVGVATIGGDEVGPAGGTVAGGGVAALLSRGDGLLKGDDIHEQGGRAGRGGGQGDLFAISDKVFFAQ
jgi:hypothetical protein